MSSQCQAVLLIAKIFIWYQFDLRIHLYFKKFETFCTRHINNDFEIEIVTHKLEVCSDDNLTFH